MFQKYERNSSVPQRRCETTVQSLVIVRDGRKLPLHGGGFSGTWFCNLVEGLILGLDGGGHVAKSLHGHWTRTKNKPSFIVFIQVRGNEVHAW
jgi:hypothetical protein